MNDVSLVKSQLKLQAWAEMVRECHQSGRSLKPEDIIPARVEHPKDKSLAEGTVKYVSTWIIAALRDRRFFTIDEAQRAVSEKLEELNRFPFKKREGNRYLAYVNEERDFMKQLPLTPYEPAVWSTAKVPLDYLISDGKNKYWHTITSDIISICTSLPMTPQPKPG